MSPPIETPIIQTFTGEDDAELLREIADWLDADGPNRVLIGLWSTGFGEAWELTIQVVATKMPGEPEETTT